MAEKHINFLDDLETESVSLSNRECTQMVSVSGSHCLCPDDKVKRSSESGSEELEEL